MKTPTHHAGLGVELIDEESVRQKQRAYAKERYHSVLKHSPEYKAKKSARCKEWKAKNRDRVNEWNKAYMRKYKETPKFKALTKKLRSTPENKMSSNIRRRLRDVMKGERSSKTELLGCSRQQLKAHIEQQFKRGMTWENYGKWHIDHIQPLASFNLQDAQQLAIACNYINLRPMWARANMEKGSAITVPQLHLPLSHAA